MAEKGLRQLFHGLWAAWSVEDALKYNMWGWSPHNYCQPQLMNWQDVKWHRRLTDQCLKG
ncbi:hypothetical protein KAH55_11200 [bacterium]|nr:hypothetical protein [bacterium]